MTIGIQNLYSDPYKQSIALSGSVISERTGVAQVSSGSVPEGDSVTLSAAAQSAFDQSNTSSQGATGHPPTPDPEPPGT